MATRTTKEKTPADPSKATKQRKKWEDVAPESALYEKVNQLILTQDKRLVFTAKEIQNLCALCRQLSVPVSIIPWEQVLNNGAKLTKQQRLTKDLWIADWQANQKKNWRVESESLQSQLDEALNEVERLTIENGNLANELEQLKNLHNFTMIGKDFAENEVAKLKEQLMVFNAVSPQEPIE
jgi:hypothetical protein